MDLSESQWQRLAIARGLYRRHNLIVLDEGRLVEEGTHEELMGMQGHYYEMYQAQAK